MTSKDNTFSIYISIILFLFLVLIFSGTVIKDTKTYTGRILIVGGFEQSTAEFTEEIKIKYPEIVFYIPPGRNSYVSYSITCNKKEECEEILKDASKIVSNYSDRYYKVYIEQVKEEIRMTENQLADVDNQLKYMKDGTQLMINTIKDKHGLIARIKSFDKHLHRERTTVSEPVIRENILKSTDYRIIALFMLISVSTGFFISYFKRRN